MLLLEGMQKEQSSEYSMMYRRELMERDRDCLPCLWVDGLQKEEKMIVAYRFYREVFSMSSSPFMLNATLKQHIQTLILLTP